ncbi:NadS family protein [Escherichia coli]|nr:NadS family protein [Escherichia coli]
MSFFDELKTSLEEAVEIKQGLKKPARVTRHEIEDAKAIREQLHTPTDRLRSQNAIKSDSLLRRALWCIYRSKSACRGKLCAALLLICVPSLMISPALARCA